MIDEVRGEPIQQVRVPGGLLHLINGLDQTTSKESGPEPVHDRARHPAILFGGDNLCQTLESFGSGSLRIDGAQFGINKLRLRFVPSRLIAFK